MSRRWLSAVLTGCLLALPGCGSSEGGGGHGVEPPEVPLPETYQEGREIFRKNCKVCHGPSATGTSQGPPLLHPYYNPNKHGDARLVRVIQEGTEQHLWEFGDMPPQPQMDREKARQVLDYIRWLQRQADIY